MCVIRISDEKTTFINSTSMTTFKCCYKSAAFAINIFSFNSLIDNIILKQTDLPKHCETIIIDKLKIREL